MPLLSPFRPQVWRLLLGFALAPLAGAGLFTVVEAGADVRWLVPAMIYGGYPATIVLGVPAFFIFRNWIRPRIATIMLTGGIIAMTPWLLLFFLGGPDYAEVGNCVTEINGKMTWCGFVGALKVLVEIFAYGAFGGLVFWLCVVWRGVRFADTTSVKK